MAYPADLKYTKDHEWIRISGDTAEIGITDYAQQQLGDVVYLDLPDVGRAITAGESFGSIRRSPFLPLTPNTCVNIVSTNQLAEPVRYEYIPLPSRLKYSGRQG